MSVLSRGGEMRGGTGWMGGGLEVISARIWSKVDGSWKVGIEGGEAVGRGVGI